MLVPTPLNTLLNGGYINRLEDNIKIIRHLQPYRIHRGSKRLRRLAFLQPLQYAHAIPLQLVHLLRDHRGLTLLLVGKGALRY